MTARRPPPAWLVRLWLLVALFGALVLWRSTAVGIPLRDPHGSILRLRLVDTAVVLAGLVALDGVRRARRAGTGWWRGLPARWTGRRTALVVAVLLAYHATYFGYHSLKSSVVLLAPQDDRLRAWDRTLCLGHDPAVFLHALLGQGLAAYPLLVVYEAFGLVLIWAVVGALVVADDVREGTVLPVAACVAWMLGDASYDAVPSLGPFASSAAVFAHLPHTVITGDQAGLLAGRAQLLAHPGAPGSFSAIAAFASLHVAMTTLLYLAAGYYGLGRVRWVALVFAAVTAVATVYFGWHFLVDDVGGVAIAVVALVAGQLVVFPGRRPRLGGPSRGPARGGHDRRAARERRRTIHG